MNSYIKDLIDLILNGGMDNTYKMSWIKSIVEVCEQDCKEKIDFDELSPLIYKYYWNQTYFFDLNQGSNVNKIPVILQLVKEGIENYKQKFNKTQPITFLRHPSPVETFVPIKQISSVLNENVSWRFLQLDGKTYDTYEVDRKNKTITLKHPELIKEYSDVLFSLINYRWSQKLEDLDGSPRVSKKILGVDRDRTPKRNSLNRFHQYLDVENPNRICFITGQEIPEDQVSIDHVIPWSYMYSDDLWNLVYVSKSVNSVKSNRLPNKEIIKKLEKRNKRLLDKLTSNGITGKDVDQLKLSNERDWVVHHWTGFKG